ncbi:MAG: NUDIX domain-containing protein [Rhodospirillales bacterium]|nr:NUDIX domain-containing protein [Rhodospirillales bacterium]
MTPDDIDIIERKTVYQGHFRLDAYRLRHRLFAGGWSGEIRREIFERGHAVAVILYDPDRDSVVLIEQFRAGALAAGKTPWLVEPVAGIVEDGETALDVARRETREEAGCEILDLAPMCEFLMSPGGSSETMRMFCGRVDSRGVGGVHGLAHEGEDIRVLVLPLDEALGRLARGLATSSITHVGLQWLALNRAELRRRWSPAARS